MKHNNDALARIIAKYPGRWSDATIKAARKTLSVLGNAPETDLIRALDKLDKALHTQ